MLWLSVGVYQRKLGGFALFAADMKSDVDTLLDVKTFGLLTSLEKPVKAKWSFPLGHPLSQYACHVNPADCIWSTRVVPERQHE